MGGSSSGGRSSGSKDEIASMSRDCVSANARRSPSNVGAATSSVY